MKTVPQSFIEKMTDLELATLLYDSGPLSPLTRDRAEAEQQKRETLCNANTATNR